MPDVSGIPREPQSRMTPASLDWLRQDRLSQHGLAQTQVHQGNLEAADVELNARELAGLAKIPVHGNRTDEDIAKLYQRG